MPLPEESERFVAMTLNPGALEADLEYEVDAEIRFDPGSRALYATDASNYRQVPIGVVIPKTRQAVINTVKICRRHGAPVLSRGGGTGLCGQTCNIAVVIDHSKYLNRILEINPEKGFARVEPGVILDHLREAAEQYHLTFGPDPATHSHNTLGGMIGNNSCGVHSVMAGCTVDNILELEVLTYDGVHMTVGPTTERELQSLIGQGGRRGEIYQGLKDIRDRYAAQIRSRFPKIPRRVSGYNLDALLPENGFNLAHALVGTEGTCVTVLEARVRLVHSPPARSMLLLGYPDIYGAGDHLPEVLKFKPVGLEGLDDLLVSFMKKKGLHAEDIKLLPEGNGWLLVEFGGDSKAESDGKAKRAMEALARVKDPPAMKLFTDEKEEKKVWQVRESGLGAAAQAPGMQLCWPGWEDAAVAPERVGEYLREFRSLLDKYGLTAALYGHFGEGCIHCRISFDLFTHEGVANFMTFLDGASDLVVKYGGSFSAEHGDGQSKAAFLRKMYGDGVMDAFRQFKSVWDPEGKMNPGKVIDPYLPDQNLRLGVAYDPWQPETHFRFPDDGGSFAAATLRCVGVGDCRRTHDVFMCPSFQATREEKHTTRGRARLLFEMFRGDFIKDGWNSSEVLEALELCLCCKACKSECPVHVDMASYKAEFLSHHYRRRLRPLAAYTMGLFGFWGSIGGKCPRLANFLLNSPVLGGVVKRMGGIAAKRVMPEFAAESFTSWYLKGDRSTYPDRKDKGDQGDRQVVLYPDIFNDCFFPETLKAALEVLQRFGYQVIIPSERPPAMRPLIEYGMLDLARRQMVKAVRQLSPFVRQGIPIVMVEPSAAAVFRDELPGMMPHYQDGLRLTKLAYLLAEFMEREQLQAPGLTGQVLLQSHCHQKAVLNADAARSVLTRMGLVVEEPEKGCCGMAGSFGFERAKYQTSMKIAEAHLLPAVRQADLATYIVADGFSCRTQIMQGSNRKAIHSAELLLLAFNRADGS